MSVYHSEILYSHFCVCLHQHIVQFVGICLLGLMFVFVCTFLCNFYVAILSYWRIQASFSSPLVSHSVPFSLFLFLLNLSLFFLSFLHLPFFIIYLFFVVRCFCSARQVSATNKCNSISCCSMISWVDPGASWTVKSTTTDSNMVSCFTKP